MRTYLFFTNGEFQDHLSREAFERAHAAPADTRTQRTRYLIFADSIFHHAASQDPV